MNGVDLTPVDDMPKERKSISFVYEEAPEKPTLAATGAYGGPSLDGLSVIAHLYIEYGSIPSVITHEVGEGGKVDLNVGTPVKRGDFTREVQGTVVLSVDAAELIGKFVIEKAKGARDAQARHKKLNP